MNQPNCHIGSHQIAQERCLDLDATLTIPEVEASRCFMCLRHHGELEMFQGEPVCGFCVRKLIALRYEENYQAEKAEKRNMKTR